MEWDFYGKKLPVRSMEMPLCPPPGRPESPSLLRSMNNNAQDVLSWGNYWEMDGSHSRICWRAQLLSDREN